MHVPSLVLALVGLDNVMVPVIVATRPGLLWFCLTVPGREGVPTLTGQVDSGSGWAGGSGWFTGPRLTQGPGPVLFWIDPCPAECRGLALDDLTDYPF